MWSQPSPTPSSLVDSCQYSVLTETSACAVLVELLGAVRANEINTQPAEQALARADVIVVHHAELLDPELCYATMHELRGYSALCSGLATLHGRLQSLVQQGRGSQSPVLPEPLVVSSSMVPTGLQRIALAQSGIAVAPARCRRLGSDLPTAFLRGKRVVAFCGIGDPLPFENSLRVLVGAGADAVAPVLLPFVDHQRLDALDAAHIARAVASMQSPEEVIVVTTEKDASRCAAHGDAFWHELATAARSAGTTLEAVYVLRAELQLTPAMDRALKRPDGAGQIAFQELVKVKVQTGRGSITRSVPH